MRLSTEDKRPIPQAVLDHYAPIVEAELNRLIDALDAFLEMRIREEFDELRDELVAIRPA